MSHKSTTIVKSKLDMYKIHMTHVNKIIKRNFMEDRILTLIRELDNFDKENNILEVKSLYNNIEYTTKKIKNLQYVLNIHNDLLYIENNKKNNKPYIKKCINDINLEIKSLEIRKKYLERSLIKYYKSK